MRIYIIYECTKVLGKVREDLVCVHTDKELATKHLQAMVKVAASNSEGFYIKEDLTCSWDDERIEC